MANAPANTIESARKMTRHAVYLASAPDIDPTEDDLRPDVICTAIHHFAGSRLSEAEFIVDLGRDDKHIENREVISNASRQIEVWTLKEEVEDEDESPRDRCLFWGELMTDRISIGNGQQELWKAIIHPAKHFGGPVEGQLVYDPHLPSLLNPTINGMNLEFNPELDGTELENALSHEAANNVKDFFIWFDPESSRTSRAINYFGGDDPARWTLKEIVKTLLGWKNEDEDYIDNPDSDYSDSILDGAPEVHNLVLTNGGHLPEYLDAILQPLGYNWFVGTQGIGDFATISTRTIRYYQRGAGTEKEVKLQAYDKTIDPKKDQVDQVSVSYDFSGVSNRITVQGAFIEREVTLPLYPSWETDDDGSHSSDISNPVNRKFVANEGGAYTNIRPAVGDPPELLDFGPPQNRVMQDCLTRRGGHRMPVLVEYRTTNDQVWRDLRELGETFTLLPTEVGIYITSELLTSTIRDFNNLELRITGTLVSDKRLEYRTDRSDDSPVSGTVERIVRAHSQFLDRQREVDGEYASVLSGASDNRNDTDEIEAYADKLLEQQTLANVQSNIRLFGLHYDFQIGDVLTKIDGRAISFNRSSSDGSAKYVQVVGVSYQLTPSQYTILHSEQYDV